MLKKSQMSGKLEGLCAINTSPTVNPFCLQRYKQGVGICADCYSMIMLLTFRANCNPAYIRNGKILSECIIPESLLPQFNDLFVRFDAHGELINKTHMVNLINMCKVNPRVTFALWTKRTDLYTQGIEESGKPNNLIGIYSESRVDKISGPPAGFDKSFCVMSKDNPKGVEILCGDKKCLDCLLCYTHNDSDIITERIKTRKRAKL